MTKSPININTEPSEEELERLGKNLGAYNTQKTGIDDYKTLNLTMSKEGALIAGLKGETGFGLLYIETLWVDENHRQQGLGSELLNTAEQEALRRGCRQACLETFSFQAKPFYESNGYHEFTKLDDFPNDEKLYFMRKVLKEV